MLGTGLINSYVFNSENPHRPRDTEMLSKFLKVTAADRTYMFLTNSSVET